MNTILKLSLDKMCTKEKKNIPVKTAHAWWLKSIEFQIHTDLRHEVYILAEVRVWFYNEFGFNEIDAGEGGDSVLRLQFHRNIVEVQLQR